MSADATPLPVALSRERHATRRWQPPADYRFARQRPFVPIVLAESEVAATALPVVFADIAGTPCPLPVALLRMQADDSPLVTPEGRWLAPYIPAILRVFPFTARTREQDARMELLVDESSGLLSDDVDARRFFDPDGSPSAALEAVVTFFKAYENSARATRAACLALDRTRDTNGQGLFRALVHRGVHFDGLKVLDRAVFDGLDDDRLLALRRAGALSLAIAHFVGCHQLDWLHRAEAAIGQSGHATSPTAIPDGPVAQASTDVTDFMSAIAMAHDDDLANRPEIGIDAPRKP